MLGKTIGNYIVRHKLGEGGMGSVYFAEHPAIGKRVALKVLHPDFVSDPEIVSRFFNEAKAVNDIQHPNIIDIVDFGTIPPPTPAERPLVYFIMEYVDGATLTQLIRRDAPLAPDRAVNIALQIADALSASHGKGVIHRDLKPDNVMLTTRGRQRDFVKLLDFGIAKLTVAAARTHRTRTGTVMGTPQYMSPEQCDGRGQIDHRSDIYALGIVLYQMLTGRVPFGGEGLGEVMIQQMTKPPLAPSRIAPQIPEAIELIVLKALEKRPEDRFQRVDEMVVALQDPVPYVAARGGRGSFLTTAVVREPAAAGATAAMTAPTASASRTVPTTLSGSASQAVALPAVPQAPSSKRFPLSFGIAVAAFVVAVVAGIVFQGSAPSKPASPPQPAAKPEPTAAPDPAPAPPTAPAAPTTPTAAPTTPAAPPAADPAASRPVHLKVSSTPPGASVTIDGELRGKTPYTGELPRRATPIELTLALPGYQSVKRAIALDGNVVLSLTLEPAPRPAPAPAQ